MTSGRTVREGRQTHRPLSEVTICSQLQDHLNPIIACCRRFFCLLHCALSLEAQCIVIGPVCVQRAGGRCDVFVALYVGLLPRELEVVRIGLHQTWSVGELVIKFWPPAPPGTGSAARRKFLAPPYYSQRAVFASLRGFF